MNEQQLKISQGQDVSLELSNAMQTGYNVSPGSTAGHYAVKCLDLEVVDADNKQFMLTPQGGELALVTEKHGTVSIKTDNQVQVFCQNEYNPFQQVVLKVRD